MNVPYELLFDTYPSDIRSELPEDCLYHFSGAQRVRHAYFDSADVLSQQLNFRPFYVEMFEFDIKSPFRMTYKVKEEQHFLFFILNGDLEFTEVDGPFISYARQRHFALSYNDAGLYRVKLQPGRHVALSVSLLPEWLVSVTHKLPVIKGYLEDISSGELPHSLLPYCATDEAIDEWLEIIYSGLFNGVGTIDGALRYYLSKILEKYELLVNEKLGSIVYQAKQYLDTHFSDAELSSELVAQHFDRSERSLRNLFKAEFNITIRDYYTSCRIRKATYLKEKLGIPVADIYYQVGYNDERTCRYEMKEFRNRMG
jgi:AraC-like DNA-binding protein